MLSVILLVGCCAALVSSAPAVEKQQEQQQALKVSADMDDFQKKPALLFGPQQQQIEFQPSFRLQQPLFQSLVPLGRIQGPNEQTMVLFYPNAPLSPLKSASNSQLLKQDPTQIFFDQFWGFIQQLPGQGGGDSGDGMSDTPAGSNNPAAAIIQLIPGAPKPQSSSNLEFEPEAEEIPKQPQLPQTPASTFPLPNYPNNFIYYTISGSPQFYGNFDYLRNSQLPFFRWPEMDLNKGQRVLDPIKEINKNEESKIQPIPALEPSESAIKAAPLTSQNLEDLQNKPGEAAKRFSQFLLEQKIYQPQPILIRPEFFDRTQSELKSDESKQFRMLGDEEIPQQQQQQIQEDQSIAQAQPVAVSVTGKGGLARAAPISTAIVGNKGIALSAPEGTSISGDFQNTNTAKSGTNNDGVHH